MSTAPVTVIVTAYTRIEQTLTTLERICACDPAADEILAHVDGNQKPCEAAICQAFPDVRVLCSAECIGPGGARNKLVAAAKNEWVASFDDDSFPIDTDYFARVQSLFQKFPAAAILCASVYHQRQSIARDAHVAEWVSDFGGGACVYRRSVFLETSGYVPLPMAYGMEEVDLALRLHAQGGQILRTPWLRVFHDTDLQRHANPAVTAGTIANLALLAYLRYPPSLWLLGAGQVMRRILWCVGHGRWGGIVSGLVEAPKRLWRYRSYRQCLTPSTVQSYLALRRHPTTAGPTWNPG